MQFIGDIIKQYFLKKYCFIASLINCSGTLDFNLELYHIPYTVFLVLPAPHYMALVDWK